MPLASNSSTGGAAPQHSSDNFVSSAFSLSASVAGDQPDSNNANDTGSGSVTCNDQIDLRVTGVSGSPSNITLATGNVTYTTTIFNGSTSQGTNPVLTMTLPAASTYVSASVTGGGSWCAKSVYRRSGAFAPRGRMMIGPNRPRKVLSVWLGPWS